LLVAVYRQDDKSATNKIFVALTLSISVWLVAAYMSVTPVTNLIWARFTIFFATPMTLLFFLLASTLPYDRLQFSRGKLFTALSCTFIVMGITVSPFAFKRVDVVDGSLQLIAGFGMVPFSLLATLFSLASIYVLFKKARHTSGVVQQQLRFVLSGILLMLGLLIVTVMIPVMFFNNDSFVTFAPIYTLVFLGTTAYAIFKHQLFSVKVIATQAITSVLWIVLFANVFIAESTTERIIDAFIFVVSLIFGILLIRSVLREVHQREELEKLTKQLRAANEKLVELDRLKSEFLSFASHQVKSPMSVVKGYASLIADGTYGEVSECRIRLRGRH